MATSIGSLAERALRRLGVAIIPVADRPLLMTQVPRADIASAALVELGVILPATEARPQVPRADIATAALVELGVIVPDEFPVLGAVVPRANIATGALIELGVIASDETPSATDQALALDKLASVQASLTTQGVASWSDATVPQAVAEEYTKLTANVMATSFGKAADAANHAMLEARVRKIAMVLSAHALALDKLASVQAALAAQAVVSWPDDAVPQAVAEEYSKLTAAALASSFGKPAIDPAIHAMLEARVHKAALVASAPELALAKLAAVQASLTSQALVWWPDDAVPQAMAQEYTQLVTHALAPSFGQKVDPAHQAVLEARVRKMALVLSAPDVATEAVLAVHRDLAARGLARWTVFDVPAAAEDPYVVLAADGMAPQFAQKTDPRDAVRAMRSLAQIIALPTSGERVTAEYF